MASRAYRFVEKNNEFDLPRSGYPTARQVRELLLYWRKKVYKG